MSIQAALYAPDGSHVTDLPRLADWQWTHVYNEPGTGQVSLRADDQAIQAQPWMVDGEPVMVDVTPVLVGHDFATRHYVVRLTSGDDEVFAFRVDPPTSTDVIKARETKTLHLAGRGVGALLDQVPILPETGLGWAPPDRPFSWISRHFEPWADVVWSTPNTHGTAAAPDYAAWELLEDWPEIALHAEWMQAGQSTPDAPAYVYPPIYSYYRATLSLPEGMDVGYFGTADDEFDLWVNGEHLISTQGSNQWRRTHAPEFTRWHEAGDHHIRIRARNVERPLSPHAPDNEAGVLFAACRLEVGEPVEVLMVSGSAGWLALGDPDNPPGMTPGLKFGLLIDEAQARGEIPAVTTATFDAEFATPRPDAEIGEEWLDNTATWVAHGTSVLSALQADAESVVDWDMTPELELLLWGHGRRARDLTGGDAPVRLTHGDLEVFDVGPPRRMVNALVVETGEGYYFEVTDDDSIGRHGRFSDFVKLGELDTIEAARPVAEQMLADRAKAEQSCDVTLKPTPRFVPYRDFTFDLIELPARAGSSFERWRVQVINCSRGKGDVPLWKLQCVLVDP